MHKSQKSSPGEIPFSKPMKTSSLFMAQTLPKVYPQRSHSEPIFSLSPALSRSRVRRREHTTTALQTDADRKPTKRQKTRSSSSSPPSSPRGAASSELKAGECTPVIDYGVDYEQIPDFHEGEELEKTASLTSVISEMEIANSLTVSSLMGPRHSNEDSYFFRDLILSPFDDNESKNENESSTSEERKNGFFGVFDGHGGKKASEFVPRKLYDAIVEEEDLITNTERAVKAAFKKVNDEFLGIAEANRWNDGTTAIVCLILDGICYVANLGDCRAVLVKDEGDPEVLSKDHKADCHEEMKLVESRGGVVLNFMGCKRVQGCLAVTRAFGDRKLKQYITAEPEVTACELVAGDSFLILASDGVWDVLTNKQAATIVQSCRESNENAANELCEKALSSGSRDNITAMVIDLKTYQ